MESKLTYHPMHMHLHTCHQPGGSMEGHIYNAASLGMHYIRFTDHDTRTGRDKNPVDGFDFSVGETVHTDGMGREHGWKIVGAPRVSFESGKMTLSSANVGQNGGVEFYSSGKRHTVSLIAGVAVTLGLDCKLTGDARAVIDIRLSQRPPDHLPAHYRYVMGELSKELPPHTVEQRLDHREDGVYCFELSEEIGSLDAIGGLDNVFDTIIISAECGENGSAEITVDRFEISRENNFDEVIKRQRIVANEIGKRYGVKPFVTSEISGAGQHK